MKNIKLEHMSPGERMHREIAKKMRASGKKFAPKMYHGIPLADESNRMTKGEVRKFRKAEHKFNSERKELREE